MTGVYECRSNLLRLSGRRAATQGANPMISIWFVNSRPYLSREEADRASSAFNEIEPGAATVKVLEVDESLARTETQSRVPLTRRRLQTAQRK